MVTQCGVGVSLVRCTPVSKLVAVLNFLQSLVSLLYTPVACLVITYYISIMVYQLPIESSSSEGILLTEESAVVLSLCLYTQSLHHLDRLVSAELAVRCVCVFGKRTLFTKFGYITTEVNSPPKETNTYYLFHVDVSKHSDAKMCGINFNCDPFIYIYNMRVCVIYMQRGRFCYKILTNNHPHSYIICPIQ